MKIFLKNFLFLLLPVYLLLSAVVAYFYRWQVNTDGLGYLSIAQNYVAGNWQTAVNGFWSPLYSWLIAGAVALGFSVPVAVKIVGVFSGLLLLLAAKKLLECFDLREFYKKTILAALTIPAVYFAVSLTTPDALASGLVILYLSLIFRSDYSLKRYGFWCGVIGGLMYLSKTYLLLFFTAHFLIFNAILFWRNKSDYQRRNLLFNFAGGIASFAVICGLWIGAIYAKYGELTPGKTGEYNLAAYGPGAAGDPLDYLGLLPPADEHSLSAWDDPGLIEIPRAWETTLTEKIIHYGNNFFANLAKTFVVIYSRFSLLALPFFAVALWLILRTAKKKIFARDYIYLILAILILQTGYLPIHIEERYIWAALPLLLTLALKIWQDLPFFKQKPCWRKILAGGVALSFILAPAYKLVSRVNTGQEYHEIYNQIKDSGISGKIASNANWSESLILAYYFGDQYFGIPKSKSAHDLQNELEKFSIDYYIFWENGGELPILLKKNQDTDSGKFYGISIYQLR